MKTKYLNAKTLQVSAKCSDLLSANLRDEKGNEIAIYDGYVPNFFPGQHYGDYVMLDIDLATGRILNWVAPSANQLAETFDQKGSE